MTKKTDNLVAYHQPAGDEMVIIAPSKKLLNKMLNKYLCKPNCEMCLAEWLIMPESKYLKANTQKDMMEAAGYKEITHKRLMEELTKPTNNK